MDRGHLWRGEISDSRTSLRGVDSQSHPTPLHTHTLARPGPVTHTYRTPPPRPPAYLGGRGPHSTAQQLVMTLLWL